MKTFADKIIAYNQTLDFQGKLPEGIKIMNPFKDVNVMSAASAFYKKYYNDYNIRRLILGINPGRFGGGVTGVPFTDTKRLAGKCGIQYPGKETYELSSVFIYDVIAAYGGVTKFYSQFYINSSSPLGFIIHDNKGKEKNYNYYDSKELTEAVFNFMIDNIRKLIDLGIETDICFCFGTGKNENFLRSVNEEFSFFNNIIALEHPRYIMQYKSKFKHQYIEKYINAFNMVK